MNLAHEPSFSLGGMSVRPSTREIVFAGGREVVEPRVMSVLVVLARAGGEVVTRDELIAACWEGRAVSDDAINRVISRIRRVAGLTDGRDFSLETITKVGYRLVTHAAAGAGPAPPAAGLDTGPDRRLDAGMAGGMPRPSRTGLVAAMLALVVALAAGVWLMLPRGGADPAPQALTLAVLPFDSFGSGAGEATFATGLARDIRNTLSRVRGLRVVSDASSFAVAAEAIGATEMSRRLGADLLLDGSYTRAGDTVKLTAELIDGATGVNVWTGAQDGPSSDLDRVRVQMSSAIFEQLVARIGPDRLERLAPAQASDPRVYALLLEAGELLNQAQGLRRRGEPEKSLDVGDRAFDLVQQALKIEPDSASALAFMAGLVSTSATHTLWTSGRSISDIQKEASDYARRALAIDPDNVRALQQLGAYYQRDAWRFHDAEPLFKRAVAIDPNDFNVRIFYSFFLSTTGRCIEAWEHVKVAIAVDPENRERKVLVPRTLKCMGLAKEADAAYRALIDSARGDLFVFTETYLYLLVRQDAPALRRMVSHVRDELWAGAPPPQVAAMITRASLAADALEGRPEGYRLFLARDLAAFDAEQAKARPSVQGRRSSDTNWTYAIEFAFAGETQRAIDLMQRAIAAGSLYIPETMPYGAFEFTPEMRADPRYQAIWSNDPRLVELKRLRLEALGARQMAGVLPDGTMVTPDAPADARDRSAAEP